MYITKGRSRSFVSPIQFKVSAQSLLYTSIFHGRYGRSRCDFSPVTRAVKSLSQRVRKPCEFMIFLVKGLYHHCSISLPLVNTSLRRDLFSKLGRRRPLNNLAMASFSPDGQYIFGNDDCQVCIWALMMEHGKLQAMSDSV